MAEAAKDQDQSMEEILQSIKRIIAEEGDPAPTSGSDVLELTDMLAEDGSLSKASAHNEGTIPTLSIEEIMAAPLSSLPVAPEPATITAAPVPAPVVAVSTPMVAEDSLISDITREASVAALDALKHIPQPTQALPNASIAFRSGTTVEDLVMESLKPMLREWLDLHLTGIVERLVEKEVRRLGGH